MQPSKLPEAMATIGKFSPTINGKPIEMNMHQTWGSKLTGFSVGHQRICLERYGKKQLDFITSGILALTIAGNILDLWINTLNKYSLDGSLTFLTYKWCIYIYYIYILYIYIY